ncbi:hypothetical protein [Methanolobus bombayensis]|uniref:hypothetical protein n=1 Tax=Methanolobus bombayensis TaxID=38023 RepID=UPI001AEA4D8C|nr:hypothetical protein [Methanolobus bombayensis]MBP1908249.1 hypothetical protein [Methanolobus bombayensis]
MYKKGLDFDQEVRRILSNQGYVRRSQLIQTLKNKHRGDSGYSDKSINRKLDSMVDRGIVSKLKGDTLKKAGIRVEDGRASFFTLKKTEEIRRHIDTIIGKISTNNPIIQKMALKELERYEKHCLLNPLQLDILIAQLDTEDIDLIDNILRIVYTYIDKKDIEPYNRQEAIKMLRSLLNKYPKPLPHGHKNLRTHFIFLLGYYNDSAIIDRLKKDAEELDNLHDLLDYNSNYTAFVIEDHREELYDFEEKLRLEGKEEPAQFIAQVRVIAMTHLGMHDDHFKENKDAVEKF